MKPFETKKLYYTIGEVSKIASVPQYLLRYWENDFAELSPSRNPKGNRVYTNKDIAIILSIKNLVYEEGYTIEKAREILRGHSITPDDVKETESFLKEHQVPISVLTEKSGNERRRKLLLETKSVLEELLDRLK
jgi:DNA-binding transcriptional MerR regulator